LSDMTSLQGYLHPVEKNI